MKAMILAAGHGTRMKPLTDHTPKPLLMVGGKSLIIWHIEKLKKAGFKDIIINIAWLGEQIPETLGDGSQFDVHLHYSDEQKDGALETAGGIIKALPFFEDKPFLVVNGDVWCDIKYSNTNPLKAGDLAHLVMVKNPIHNPKGNFTLIGNRLTVNGETKFTFSGIGYYHPDLFRNLKYGKRRLAPLLRRTMNRRKASGELHEGIWQDIGTIDRLTSLNKELSLINTKP